MQGGKAIRAEQGEDRGLEEFTKSVGQRLGQKRKKILSTKVQENIRMGNLARAVLNFGPRLHFRESQAIGLKGGVLRETPMPAVSEPRPSFSSVNASLLPVGFTVRWTEFSHRFDSGVFLTSRRRTRVSALFAIAAPNFD